MPTSKQRREAARRHLERQLERRQQRDARRRQMTLVGTVVGTLVIFAIVITTIVMLTHDNKKSTTAAGTPTGTATPSASASSTAKPGECNFVAGGTAVRKVSLPAAKAPTSGIATATVKTTQGDMTFRLDRSKAPCTVASFASLITQKYYDNTPCHRLTTSGIFVLQCGDPTGVGSGGPGYTIPDEKPTTLAPSPAGNGTVTYPRGTLAMAKTSAPNSGGSQFFLVYADSTLPPDYTVFGRIDEAGLATIDKVAAAGADDSNGAGDGKPKTPVEIQKVTVS